MNTEKLFLVDPYNEEHLRMIKEFEEYNEIGKSIISALINETKDKTKNEYELIKKESNDVSMSLFLEDSSSIKDLCYIQGVKDRKSCNIFFAPLKNRIKNRKLVLLSTEFALNTMGMKEVFISVSSNDKQMKNYMLSKGFESLGEDKGKVIYLKEKEETDINQRTY